MGTAAEVEDSAFGREKGKYRPLEEGLEIRNVGEVILSVGVEKVAFIGFLPRGMKSLIEGDESAVMAEDVRFSTGVGECKEAP
jgi:hypothetical protein